MKRIGMIITTILVMLQLSSFLWAQPVAFTNVVQPLELEESMVLEPIRIQEVLLEDSQQQHNGGSFRFALCRTVMITPETDGVWEEIDDNILLWRVPIISSGAMSLSLGFTQYSMPPDGKLYVYSTDYNQVLGPFTSEDNEEHGQLWTPILNSDSLVVELSIPADQLPQLQIKLEYINHGYRDIRQEQIVLEDIGDADLDNVNVACSQGNQWRDQIRSVARFIVNRTGESPPASYWSTGFLINNTAQDGKPYLLTAFHSFDDDDNPKDGILTDIEKGYAETIVIYWNFQALTCYGTTAENSQTQTGGGVLRAAYSVYMGTDFALVELNNRPSVASNVFYAGWDRRNLTPSGGVAIHHPKGDLKKISIEEQSLTITSRHNIISPGDGNYLHIFNWDTGTTEGGSSGCPLFNPDNKLVIGHLSGGLTTYSGDWFGRIYKSWTGGDSPETRLSNWLDPLNTGTLSLDGKNPPTEPSSEGVVFEDTFPSGSIDREKWPVVDGAWIYNVGYDASSPPYALLMNGTPNGGDMIESKTIDLSSSTYAILNYHYDKATLGDPPDPGDDLIISYLSTQGWKEIDRQLGVGSHMHHYRLVSIHLPENALHANFKIRIESIGDPGVDSQIYDNWFVDDVNIVAIGGNMPIKVFEETFPNDLMDSPLWQKMYGVNVRGTGLNEPSPPYCLQLNGHPGNYDDVWSKEIDLSDYSRAVLSYYYSRMGGYESPDTGDDLIISYMSPHGWVEIDRQLGSGPDMWSFSDQVRINLPSDALHERFMFRIQSIGTPNWYYIYDDWFVDDIVVEVWR